MIDKQDQIFTIETTKHTKVQVDRIGKMPFIVAKSHSENEHSINSVQSRKSHQNEEIEPMGCSSRINHYECGSVIASIQEHIIEQNKKNIQRSLFKQSVVKYSVDKEFAYLFEESAAKQQRNCIKQQPEELLLEVNHEQEKICQWLDSDQERAIAKLSFRSYMRLMQILDFKVERLAIIVTNFHGYFSQKLDELNSSRKVPIQWACLSTTLSVEVKSKILEMYELGKLKLLLISPELFENEEYHSFQCELLTVSDTHLYVHSEGLQLLQKIIRKTSPKRVLGLYEHISPKAIEKLKMHNLGRNFNYESHFLLKSADKQKTLINFIGRGNYNKILIVVSNRREAVDLFNSLSLQSMKTINLTDMLPKFLIANFSLPSFLTKQYKNQQLLSKILSKTHSYNIVVSVYFEGLRLLDPELVVVYNLTTLDKYLQISQLGKHTCGLVSNDDYHHTRNITSSALVDSTSLDRLLMNILDTNPDRTKDRKPQRFFSETLDDIMFKKFSVDKQEYLTADMKSIKISQFCSEFQITRDQFEFVMESLQECRLVARIMKNISYECWIQESDAQAFRQLLPSAVLVHNKVNLLNLSNQMNITTKQLISMMRKNKIRYSVCEQIIPLKILGKKIQGMVELVAKKVREKVHSQLEDLDLSFGVFQRVAYPNLQFLRRDKSAIKRSDFASYLDDIFQGKYNVKHSLQYLPNQKINNLREQAYHQKTIEQWLNSISSEESDITPHEVVLFLQGVPTPKMEKFQAEGLFKIYYRYKYEDLMELVSKVMNNKKKLKLE